MSVAAVSTGGWRRRALLALAAVIVGAVAVHLLRHDSDRLDLRVRWVQSYPDETWDRAKTGLYWSLSFLGARLEAPEGDIIATRPGQGEGAFDLRLARAGFSAAAERALATLLDAMKSTDEYHRNGAIDLGRFVAVTLGNSWNYYAVTGARDTFAEFLATHPLERSSVFPVINSYVSAHPRLLRFVVGPELAQMHFVAEELSGAFGAESTRTLTREVFDIMPNGQLRFAVYGETGDLLPATPTTESSAGKPAKCLWCHEINPYALLRETPDVPAYMTGAQFSSEISRARYALLRQRSLLSSRVDFRRTQDHTETELLYIAFMEPSADRLAREWRVDLAEVRKRMAGQPTHIYAEFPFLGQLYDRKTADRLSDYRAIPAPNSVREPVAGDPGRPPR